MLLPRGPHLHPHRCHPRPHTCPFYWLPGQTSQVQSLAVITGGQSGLHRTHGFHYLPLRTPRCPVASRNALCHPCNGCLSGHLGLYFQSQALQAPLHRCKGMYASTRPRRNTDGNYRNTVAIVDASDTRCRCIVRLSLAI